MNIRDIGIGDVIRFKNIITNDKTIILSDELKDLLQKENEVVEVDTNNSSVNYGCIRIEGIDDYIPVKWVGKIVFKRKHYTEEEWNRINFIDDVYSKYNTKAHKFDWVYTALIITTAVCLCLIIAIPFIIAFALQEVSLGSRLLTEGIFVILGIACLIVEEHLYITSKFWKKHRDDFYKETNSTEEELEYLEQELDFNVSDLY